MRPRYRRPVQFAGHTAHPRAAAPVLTLLGTVLLVGCGAEPPQAEEPLRPVVFTTVGNAGGATQRSFSGTAVTGRVVNLSFRTSGILTRLDAVLGQTVQAGRLVAQLDNVASRLAYEQAVVSLNGAASQMNTARLALDRTAALYESGTASLSDYESARNAFRTAEASHESAARSVDIQQEQLNYGSIYAPVGGTIAAVNAEIDEVVQAGQTVAVLNAGADLEVALGLPEAVIAQAAPGLSAEITFAAVPGVTFAGTITEVSPSVDPATATYPVRISLDEATDDIRSGMAASVLLTFPPDPAQGDALVVPAKAVGEDGSGRFVFVVEGAEGGEGTVQKRRVEVGRLTGAGFEILEGVATGERVATAGLQTLLDGQRVLLP